MRKIIVLSFITLDDVMLAPGGSEEEGVGARLAFLYPNWCVAKIDNQPDATNIAIVENFTSP